MASIFEAGMLICFGLSWPFNIGKSLRSRTAKGKSIVFEMFIFFGYVCGILGKVISHNISYLLFIYVIDLLMVATDLIITFRNKRLDEKRLTQ